MALLGGASRRGANTHRGARIVSPILTLALVASVLYPLLSELAPTQRAYAAPYTAHTSTGQSSFTSSNLINNTPVDVCQLYPIALHTASLSGVAVGGSIGNIYNGVQPGNFGWLSWTGDQGDPALVTSLTPPGNSTSYVNPSNPTDHVLVVGDWVDARPGVANSSAVRAALTQLESQDIVVPVWDQSQGTGSGTQYHVVGFAQVRITGFQLPGANTISARYLGSTDCLGTPPPPPPPPPSPFNGATLTLSPSAAGPNVTTTTQTLQAALTSRTGTPLSGVSVQFTVTGANPTTFSGTTDGNGLVSFTYTGTNQGTDSVQATATDSSGAQLQSNTASVYWVTPSQTVSTTTLWGRFYPNPNNAGTFTANPSMTPSFSEGFPTIDFNPPSGTVPGNTSGVNEFTRPITDVTTDLNGNFTGTIPAQGNGYQAGVGPLETFDAVFTGAFTVAAAGQVTYNFYTDDGFILGIGSDAAGDQPARVGGADTNPPPSGKTPFENFAVMGAYNVPTSPAGNQITVNFPAPGTYPYELDYSECCGGQLAVTVATTTATGTQGVPPTGSLTLSPNTVATQAAGVQQTFTVLASYASGAAIPNLPVTLTIVGANAQRLQATTDSTGHASFTYTATYAGTDTVQAVAWVSGLAAYSGQVNVQWTTPPTPPPVPQTVTQGWVGSPASQSTVTGQVPITLASGVTLSSGTVTMWPASNPNAVTTLASNVSGSGGATLATLDTTTLANGSYIIALNGTNSSGAQLNSEVLIDVAGESKPGRVTFSVTDLTVPVAGLPITVGRTYDSLNRNLVGDFGNGWSLSLGSPKLSVDPANNVTITLPDGRRATFAFTPKSVGGLFGFLLTPGYTPEPGVYGSLTADGCGLMVVSGGQLVCFLADQYAPTTYKYTDPYGRVYTMGADGTLKSITDLNGNELVFGPTGITSAAGNSVSFTRDSQGRITQIKDPSGNVYGYSYDANGNLASVSLPGQSTPIQYTYDSNHLLLSVKNASGTTAATVTYDSSGRLASITDAAGDTTAYSYDLTTNTTTVTAPDGGVTIYKDDSYGKPISETDPLGRTVSATYDSNHNLTTFTDALGNKFTYTYDSQGNPTSFKDPLGKSNSATFNQFGGPATLTDPLGNTLAISYSPSALPVGITDSLGTLATVTYDSHGNLLTQTDGAGNTRTSSYDAYGNLLTQTDALNHTVSYTYDQLGRKLTSKDADGNTTSYSYDALGRLVKVTDPAGGVTTYTYDGSGNKTSMKDPLGRTTTYTYDALNRLTQTTYPDGTTTKTTYDFRGNPLTQTDQAGRVTQYAYDLAGELTSVTKPDGSTTSYTYDADGHVLTQKDALGNTTSYAYDADGRLVTVTDALGHVTSYTYDAAGHELSMKDANGHTTTYAYDARGHLVTTTYPDGTTLQDVYDGAGNVTSETDQAGNTTTYTYDPNARLLSVADALGHTTHYAYDASGNLMTITDANGHQTSFAYDKLNRVITKTWPDTSAEHFTYDAVGNLLSHQLADGHTNGYSYDTMNRLEQVSYFDGTSDTYSYTPTGQTQTVVDARGTTTYSYDSLDRVVKIAVPDGQSVSYTYDANGNRASMAAAVGSVSQGTTTYSYDKDNQLVGVNAPTVGSIGLAYDAAGNQTQRTLPNGIAVSYGYDALNRLTSVSETAGANTLASYTYTLDPTGNRTKVVNADGSSTLWSYDKAYRLVGETQLNSGGTQTSQTSYTYDAVGNRLSMTAGSQTTQYTYNALDQLTSTSGAQTTQYTYDGRGNLVKATDTTANTTTSYSYNAADQLVGATLPSGASVTYGYDAAGRQVSQTSGGQTTNYLWDEASPYGDVILETNGSGTAQASYTLANGELLAQVRGSTASYDLPDGQGSVRALANGSGAITDSYTYDAYGNLLSSTGSTTNPYRYDAQRLDAQTGLYQMRARSYDPTTGRFVSRDTAQVNLVDPTQLDRYTYASENPTTLFDPSGHEDAVEVAILDDAETFAVNEVVFELEKSIVLALVREILYSVLEEEDAAAVYEWFETAVDVIGDVKDLIELEDDLAKLLQLIQQQYGPGGSPSGGGNPGGGGNPPGGGGGTNTGNIVNIYLQRARYPQSTDHIDYARTTKGLPSILTLYRPGASTRRRQCLSNNPPSRVLDPNGDLDEYPPAVSLEDGPVCDVWKINAGDNRGAGASMGNQLRPYANLQLFTIVLV